MNQNDAARFGFRRATKAHWRAFDQNTPGAWLEMAGKDFHERGFARAVLADDGLNLAGAEIEADVLQHLHRAEGFRQAFDRNGWGGRT